VADRIVGSVGVVRKTSARRERARAAEVAVLLRGVLDEVDAERLEALPADRARIEGALIACEVLAGADVDSIVERLLRRP
jgi:hypothetical protein